MALRQALDLRLRRLDEQDQRLRLALRAQRQRRDEQLARLTLRLAAVDPHQVLARGYAWLTDGSNRPITQAAGLQAGARLSAIWADGRAAVEVLSVTPGAPDPA